MIWEFNKGLSQLKICDVKSVKTEIMDVLRIKTEVSYHRRRNGQVEPKISEALAIEEIFRKRGITEIWGAAQ